MGELPLGALSDSGHFHGRAPLLHLGVHEADDVFAELVDSPGSARGLHLLADVLPHRSDLAQLASSAHVGELVGLAVQQGRMCAPAHLMWLPVVQVRATLQGTVLRLIQHEGLGLQRHWGPRLRIVLRRRCGSAHC